VYQGYDFYLSVSRLRRSIWVYQVTTFYL